MDEIIKNMKDFLIEKNYNKIKEQYPLIENELDKMFLEMSKLKKFEDTKEYFTILEKIQFELAILFFKEKLESTQKLYDFVSDYDRIDDLSWRKYLFKKIKKGKYYGFLYK